MKEKKENSRPMPYHHHIALTIIIITLLPCIILSGICLKLLYPQWLHASLEEHYNAVEYTSLSVSDQLNEMYGKMQYILYDTAIRPYISQADQLTLPYQLELLEKLDETANSLTVDNSEMVIRWYPYTSKISYGSNCIPLKALSQEFDAMDNVAEFNKILSLSDGKVYWTVRHISRNINNKGTTEDRLCLYTQFGSSSKPNCVLELSIPLSQLYNSQNHEEVENGLFVFSQNNGEENWNIVLGTNLPDARIAALLNAYHTDGRASDYHIINISVPNIRNGEIIFFLPDSYVRISLLPYIITFIGIALLVASLIVATSYITSHILTRRIIQFIDEINNNLDAYFCHSEQQKLTSGSIAQISKRIQQLIQNTQQYCSQLEYYEAENLRIELELLQMRFNPHLLYNTLSTLKVHIKDKQFQNTIDSLCKYYRIILNNGHLLIKIKDELEMVREYLFIQINAYGLSDIEYMFEIDEQVNDYSVIKHILQPIVENAINHGLKPAKRIGLLSITASLEGNDVVINITDNGVGMSPETIGKLLTQPLPSRFSGGYGIYNVQQRIQLYYGSKYGLTIESKIGQGTSVHIRIPARINE